MHELWSSNWVDILVRIVGLILGTISIVVAWRSRRRSKVSTVSQEIVLIGGAARYPDRIEVRYRGEPVPRVTASTVWIWNSGNTTVRGSDIVQSDPPGFQFPGKILSLSVRKVTRDVIGIRPISSPEPDTAHVMFEFLDPGDGAVLEILHDGESESPKYFGTVIGLPKDPDSVSTLHKRESIWKGVGIGKRVFIWSYLVFWCVIPLIIIGMNAIGVAVWLYIWSPFLISAWRYRRTKVPPALED